MNNTPIIIWIILSAWCFRSLSSLGFRLVVVIIRTIFVPSISIRCYRNCSSFKLTHRHPVMMKKSYELLRRALLSPRGQSSSYTWKYWKTNSLSLMLIENTGDTGVFFPQYEEEGFVEDWKIPTANKVPVLNRTRTARIFVRKCFREWTTPDRNSSIGSRGQTEWGSLLEVRPVARRQLSWGRLERSKGLSSTRRKYGFLSGQSNFGYLCIL